MRENVLLWGEINKNILFYIDERKYFIEISKIIFLNEIIIIKII